MTPSSKTLDFFRQIVKIPRASKKEQQISNWLVDFARQRNLEVRQDEFLNVVIKKPASEAACANQTLILQSHLDMVYETATGSHHRYEDGIEIVEKGDFWYANGTTLGADNGIGVAYCLAILDDNTLKHPNIEAVFTTEEEIGLNGVMNLDTSDLKGKLLINLDSEEEDILYVSCAGGVRVDFRIPVLRQPKENLTQLAISFRNLKGGHSGIAIDKERGNAIKLAGRLLQDVLSESIFLHSISASGKSNAIASKMDLTLALHKAEADAFIEKIHAFEKQIKQELAFSDSFDIVIEPLANTGEVSVFTPESAQKLVAGLLLLPNGVVNMSSSIPGLVQTSCNVGSLEEKDGVISLSSSIRSSVASQKAMVGQQFTALAQVLGGSCSFHNDYPQWEYKADSPLRDLTAEVMEEVLGKKPQIAAIHAGLECGYFTEKIADVDMVSIGANLYDVHTPEEHVSCQSVENVWQILKQLMARLCE